ncbi:MAG: GIY-YIG nuclease family protein [Flavobacteriales bacterium]|nr:GIY-YIG nuclease family protein [Flavobacteriales bacterium]
MATVYILYSKLINSYYTGSCKDLSRRIELHQNKVFPKAFTTKADDWELFLSIEHLEYQQARNIEAHIKRMKSRTYIENLKRYAEMREKLIKRYDGSPR